MCPNCGRPYGKRKRCYYCNGRARLVIAKPAPSPRPKKVGCLVLGCTEHHEAQGYCSKHYQRWQRYGDPLALQPNARGTTIRKDGYVALSRRSDRGQLVHRRIMEQSLGRLLESNEHVHHLNGDRADNRLENLEVLTAGEHQRTHNLGLSTRVLLTCKVCGSQYERVRSLATTSTCCSKACRIKAMHAAIAKSRETHTWGKRSKKQLKV